PVVLEAAAREGTAEGHKADPFQIGLSTTKLSSDFLPVGNQRVDVQVGMLTCDLRPKPVELCQGRRQRSTHHRLEVPERLVAVKEDGLDRTDPLHYASWGCTTCRHVLQVRRA